ncbi:MAG: flagellar biosynthetic protein FliO [Gammaproteobacteria bacterium SHHR-1]|uniref:FliO/MopB family protein n=1 Tax=Magnetovirga frankeli TaxID=947516 RepID=UPI001292E361|nr:flagellar biosynthetic protein FliO [gamma proteobacterium SS-5]
MIRSLALFLPVLPGIAGAAQGGGEGVTAVPPMTTHVSYVEAFGGLLLVLLLILAMGWLVKRLGISPAHRGAVRVVGGVSLGGRERALLLEVEGQRILVGVAPGQVRRLLQLPEADAAEDQGRADGAGGFATQLKQQLGQQLKPKNEARPGSGGDGPSGVPPP